MSFRASHLKSILDNLGSEEYTRIVNAARFNDQSQLGQLVSEMDPRDFDFAIHFVNKIKDRFNNNVGIYKQFLDILSTYRRDKHTIVQIYNKVKDLFSNHPDLFDEFQKFLPDPTLGINPPEEEPPIQHTTFVSPEEIAFFERVQRLVGSESVYIEFLKVINLYNQDIISKAILVERVAHFLSKSPDAFNWFRSYINFNPPTHSIVNQFNVHNISLNEPFSSVTIKPHFNSDNTPISQRNVQSWQVNGSYRLMPTSHSPSSGRDPLSNSVLNDLWVSHPTWASEDESFSVHPKNIHEETLHRTEDEKFELDMKILTNQVAIQSLQLIAKQLSHLNESELNSHELSPSDFKSTLYKKAIRVIYDDVRGEEMINGILKKPNIAVPIVLHKLQLNQSAWLKDRRELDKIWRQAFKLNFWKALDHQGAAFKNNDKKILTPKSVLLELQVANQQHHKEFIDTNIPKPLYDLEFEFSQPLLDSIYEMLGLYSKSLNSIEHKKFDKTYPILFDLLRNKEALTVILPVSSFVFIKLIHLLQTRLLELKSLKIENITANPVAIGLNYQCVPKDTSIIDENRFELVMKHCLSFIQNYEDSTEFEKQCMACYGLEGYKLYTVDKLLLTVKGIVFGLSDNIEDIMAINATDDDLEVKLDRMREMNIDDCVKIKSHENVVRILLLPLVQPKEQPLEEWSTYVDNFLHAPTREAIDLGNAGIPNDELKRSCIVALKGQSYRFIINEVVLDKLSEKENKVLFEQVMEINKKEVEAKGFLARTDEILKELGRKYNIKDDQLWCDMELITEELRGSDNSHGEIDENNDYADTSDEKN